MANYNGNAGVIKAVTSTGTPAAVGEVKSFSLDTACAEQDATSMGDAWDTVEAGRKSWNGSLEAHYDPAAAPQVDLIEGEKCDMELLPTTGYKFTGTALVTGVSYGVTPEERVSVSITFKGNGALTRAAVT